jgi:putative FmdB family regulatory protein
MPTYAYRCTKCDHEFEAFEKITARPRARKCPVCGGRAERVISGGAGFLFKGEGFYITDYRSEEYRSRAREEKDTAAEPAAKPPEAAQPSPAAAPKPEKPSPKKPAGGKKPSRRGKR